MVVDFPQAIHMNYQRNIEVELGGSIVRTRYDLLNEKDVVIKKDLTRTLVLPTRVSLSIVYVP